VTANIISVGQNSDGSIEVPGPYDVGWYNLGPTPGEVGPAVLVGHVDYVTTGPAVFWNLRNMKPNDTVQITRQDGKTVTFKVEKVASYGQDNFPTQQVYGNISYPGLRLVTCTGDFNYITHHYSDNLVVYARAEL
jgi:sortase (surface protein transpeptidase)